MTRISIPQNRATAQSPPPKSALADMKIYTAGYQSHTPLALRVLAECLQAAVVDVRLSPRSANPAWRLPFLQATFGDRYLHLGEWGNIHYNDGLPIQISDFAGGLHLLQAWLALEDYQAVILLCQCRDAECCHRTVLANSLRELGCAVRELDWLRQLGEEDRRSHVSPEGRVL